MINSFEVGNTINFFCNFSLHTTNFPQLFVVIVQCQCEKYKTLLTLQFKIMEFIGFYYNDKVSFITAIRFPFFQSHIKLICYILKLSYDKFSLFSIYVEHNWIIHFNPFD